MSTLPAPRRANYSAISMTTLRGFADVAAQRPGNGFTITKSNTGNGDWIEFRFDDADSSDTIVVSINQHGIPAVIAELQRLVYGTDCDHRWYWTGVEFACITCGVVVMDKQALADMREPA